MKFSVGLLDSIFGEKVIFELPDKNGNTIQSKMTKKFYDKMISENKMEQIIKVKLFNSYSGLSETEYKFNEEISEETYNKFVDKVTGYIHIFEFYDQGELKKLILTKEKFEETLKEMENI